MIIESHLTAREGGLVVQTTISYSDEDYSREAMDSFAAAARQALDCQHVMGLSLGDAPVVLYQIEGRVAAADPLSWRGLSEQRAGWDYQQEIAQDHARR
jgi:hypothetical protein